MLTLKEEIIKALTTTEGLLYSTLPELFGQVLAVASTWLREQSGGCEANLCSPPVPKMKQLQSDTLRAAGRRKEEFS